MSHDPRDQDLVAAFRDLDPPGEALVRLEARVLADLEADAQSFVDEWLDLLRAGPLLSSARVALAAASLAVLTPLGTALILLLTFR
jgi:hypothetical protein